MSPNTARDAKPRMQICVGVSRRASSALRVAAPPSFLFCRARAGRCCADHASGGTRLLRRFIPELRDGTLRRPKRWEHQKQLLSCDSTPDEAALATIGRILVNQVAAVEILKALPLTQPRIHRSTLAPQVNTNAGVRLHTRSRRSRMQPRARRASSFGARVVETKVCECGG